MREIKFRAWDKKQTRIWNKWQRGSLISKVLEQLTSKERTSNDPFKIEPATMKSFVFMQYTGLLDKNGKEIYEGDIVEIFGKPEQVVYAEIDGGYEGSYGMGFNINPFHTEDYEVIGNIYEHPNLLKDKGSNHNE